MSRKVDPVPTGKLLERLNARSTKFITYCLHAHGFDKKIQPSVVKSHSLMIEGERQSAVIDYQKTHHPETWSKWQHFKELFK